MCLGGHLAFRAAFDSRVLAAVCFFGTDIHSETLGKGKNSDSLKRVKEIKGELVMIFGKKVIKLSRNDVTCRILMCHRKGGI
jgi:carboxymethylenebutenolidase